MSKDKDKDKDKIVNLPGNNKSKTIKEPKQATIPPESGDLYDLDTRPAVTAASFKAVISDLMVEANKRPKSQRTLDFWNEPEQLEKITAISQLAFKDHEIASFIGISRRTFYRWLAKSEKLEMAITSGRVLAKGDLISALRSLALGTAELTHTAVPNSKGELRIVKTVINEKAPDRKAIEYLLQNIEESNTHWKSSQSLDISVVTNDPVDDFAQGLSIEDTKLLMDTLRNKQLENGESTKGLRPVKDVTPESE